MPNELVAKVKTGLNETRLLILGAQVLLGFQFQAFFQDGFSDLAPASQYLCLCGLGLVILAIAFLVMPTMEHRLIEEGRSTVRLVEATSFYTGLGLAPLAVSLGLASYVVVDRHFGTHAGVSAAVALGGIAAFAWFGFECLVGLAPEKRPMEKIAPTPLSTKIEQLLTEARVIIPGAQALFGFQFVAMLTTAFDRLPQSSKVIHAAALGLIALNVVLLMTPAALHRLSFGGDDSVDFLRMGSALVIAAPFFLAAGISAESYVVLQKVVANGASSIAASCATFFLLVFCWYALPLLLRASGKNSSAQGGKTDAPAVSR
jgi:hypothetical protein